MSSVPLARATAAVASVLPDSITTTCDARSEPIAYRQLARLLSSLRAGMAMAMVRLRLRC